MIDFYELLGIRKDATIEEIKDAYRKMVKKYHPDINKTEEANKIIVSLNEAKEILLDAGKRRAYDAMLKDIESSKQFSKDKTETYSTKTREYKENYADVSVTKWEFLFNYLKNGLDNFFEKYIKFVLVFLNFLVFLAIKGVCFGLVFLVNLTSGLIDYFAGIIMLCAVLSLFVLAGQSQLDSIPFIPANYQKVYEQEKGYTKEVRVSILTEEFKKTFSLELNPIFELKYSKSKNVWTLYYFENYVVKHIENIKDLLKQNLYEQKLLSIDASITQVDGIDIASNIPYLLSIDSNIEKLRDNLIECGENDEK